MQETHKAPGKRTAKLQVDFSSAAHHLRILDPNAEAFTFATFTDGKAKPKPDLLASILNGTLEEHFVTLTDLNRRGAGVFVTVNETDLKGRKKKNIKRIRTLWQEADRGDEPDLPLEPHLVIQSSPGKCHRYVLVDGMPLQDFEATQQRLVDDYGSDPNAKDRARVLRLAGFFHLKGEPYQVRIIHESGAPPYPWSTVRKAFPPARLKPPVGTAVDFDPKKWPQLRKAIERIDPTVSYHDWLRIGMALHSTGHPDAFATWDGWSRNDPARYKGTDDLASKWHGFNAQRDSSVGPATILWLAKRHRFADALAEPGNDADDLETDDGLALAFVQGRAGNLRWVEVWHRWYEWGGKTWREDRQLSVFDLVRDFLRQCAASQKNRRKHLLEARQIAAIEKLARSDGAVATSADEFDGEPWLLNTQTGVVDLRTGQLQLHSHDLLMTKITACGVGGDCPRWEQFLMEVTGNDLEMVGFLQRTAGYCLTGSTREHALFFLYGTGGNGKGVFLNTLRAVMADYAKVSSTEVFTLSRGDRHPTELAALRGARLVVAQEVEDGRRWAEARIKSLTGGDPVSARFMRQDFFEYVPNFKLVIAGNHKPRLSTVDEAIRRRLYLVPFEVSISESQRDPDLLEKLELEHAGILAWAVQGCLDYLQRGLDAPECVKAATEAYLASQDVIREFLADCCETGPGYWEAPAAIFTAWRNFAVEQNLQTGRQTEFRDRLEQAGLQQVRNNQRGRHWQGVRVKDVHTPAKSHFQGRHQAGQVHAMPPIWDDPVFPDDFDMIDNGMAERDSDEKGANLEERDLLWMPDPKPEAGPSSPRG